MSNPGTMTYGESDHPRMGTIRKSSQRNELLMKPNLGKVKRPTRDIPGESFCYGLMYEEEDGVAAAMVHRGHVPNPHATKGQDIRGMNKRAPKMHVVRSDEQRQYRREHPLKLKVKKRIAYVPPLPSETNPDHVYGVTLPRGETAEELMVYKYAEDWIKINQEHQHDYGFIKPQFVPPKTCKVVETRSEACYQKYHPPPPKERFIISKFKKVPHKIDNVQTTPLLRDDRMFISMKKRGGVFGAQAQIDTDEGDQYPSCGIIGQRPLPCSGICGESRISSLLPRTNHVCVEPSQNGNGRLLPRAYRACNSNTSNTCTTQPCNQSNPCSTYPKRSDPDKAVTTVLREATITGPKRSDPD